MKPEELTKWRRDRGLTMGALGELLGVTHVCISRYESGLRKIPPFLALALSALKVKKGDELKKSKGKRQIKKGKEGKK